MSEKSNESLATAPLSRRRLFSGLGAAGAVAAAAAALPLVKPAPVAVALALPNQSEGGYQLTEHVERYYETARV